MYTVRMDEGRHYKPSSALQDVSHVVGDASVYKVSTHGIDKQ